MKTAKFLCRFFLAISLFFFIGNTNKHLQGAQQNNNEIIQIELAIGFYQNGEYQKSIQILEAIAPSLRTNYLKGITFNNLGSAYSKIGNLTLAIKNLEKAISYLRNSENSEAKSLLVKSTLFLAQTFLEKGVTSKALPLLKQIETVSDSQLRAKVKTLLGQSYLLQKDFNKAIEYYQESLAITELPVTKISLARVFF